jgi:putative transposase
MQRKRPRLRPSCYIGLRRYFITFCTAHRQALSTDATSVALVLSQFERCATDCAFALLAYCFMPDHVHLLIEGCAEGADAIGVVHQSKQ